MFGISLDILFVYFLLLCAVFLFVNKRISFDVASLIIMACLIVSGILTPSEGLSGFSNSATLTIACMFILSEGLTQTGALDKGGDYFLEFSRYLFKVAVLIIMLIIGVISAFINNTAAVAIFIPVLIGLSKKLGKSASKLLMPLSFAAMFGGVSTLTGTSTNLLVDSIATDNGLQPFSMFEFAPMGIIYFVAGFIYLFVLGIDMIPCRREKEDLTENFGMGEYLTDVKLGENSEYVDTPLAVGIIIGMVGLAAFGVMPIMASAICGVVLMILSGCLTNEEAWRSINWKVIFLLAGMLPLGVAMGKTGAASLMADTSIAYLEAFGPRAVLSAFFFLFMMLTNVISNQARAALQAPITIEVSQSIGVNAEPMLVAVTMAALLSFMSPIGYQTNTMIFGLGQYRFSDFLRIGTPLNLIFLGLGTLSILMIWSF